MKIIIYAVRYTKGREHKCSKFTEYRMALMYYKEKLEAKRKNLKLIREITETIEEVIYE